MFNPWVLLAVVIFWIISVGAAGLGGARYQAGQDSEAQLTAVNKAVEAANALSEKDKQLAVIQAQRNTAAQTRASLIGSQANATIQAHSQPVICDWDQPSFSLLIAAIREANGNETDSSSVPDAVRRVNSSGEQQSGHSEKLGNQRSGQSLRRVPSTAR